VHTNSNWFNSLSKSTKIDSVSQKIKLFESTTLLESEQSLPTLSVCILSIIHLVLFHNLVRTATRPITTADTRTHRQYRHSHLSVYDLYCYQFISLLYRRAFAVVQLTVQKNVPGRPNSRIEWDKLIQINFLAWIELKLFLANQHALMLSVSAKEFERSVCVWLSCKKTVCIGGFGSATDPVSLLIFFLWFLWCSSENPKALLFQIRSGWNLAGLFFGFLIRPRKAPSFIKLGLTVLQVNMHQPA